MSPAEFAALTGGAIALVGLLTAGWKAVKGLYRLARRIEVIAERSEQLVANSGTSMFDRVNQTHETVHQNSDRLTALEEHQEEQDKKIHRNQGRIEALALVTSPTMLVEEEGKFRESGREGSKSR